MANHGLSSGTVNRSYRSAQCLIFFLKHGGGGNFGEPMIQDCQGLAENTSRSTTRDSKSTQTTPTPKAYALLPAQQHVTIAGWLIQDYGIHVPQNGDVPAFEDNLQELERVEVFLPETPTCMVNPNSVTPDLSFLRSFFPLNIGHSFGASDVRPAVDSGNCEVFRQLLRRRYVMQYSLLHLATSRNQEVLVRVALDYGADINEQTSEGSTALHIAVANHFHSLVQLLVERDANGSLMDNARRTPFEIACETENVIAFEILLNI